MKDAPPPALRPEFWTLPLARLNASEWEALCDGCGRCCLAKLEDADSGEVLVTRVACRLLDDESCRCANYPGRLREVPECIVLTPRKLPEVCYWLPDSCAYKRRHLGQPLPQWHPLISGDPMSVHHSGASVRGKTVSELTVREEDWEDHLLDDDPL